MRESTLHNSEERLGPSQAWDVWTLRMGDKVEGEREPWATRSDRFQGPASSQALRQ